MGVCVSRGSSTIQQTVGKGSLLNDENLVNRFAQVLKNAQKEPPRKESPVIKKRKKEEIPSIDELDPTKEVRHPDFNDHVEPLEFAYPTGPPFNKEPRQAKQAERQKNKEQIWKHKPSKNNFAQESKYAPPESSMEENVYIRHMPNPGHSSKRLIVCMSDMHLDSRWSRLIDEHLNEFMIKMSSVAEQKVNTVVLLGDIVDMWLTRLTKTPPTPEENMKRWLAHPGLTTFVHVVRKMAEEDDVKVFYLRGSHDHDIDAKAVETLFGSKVEFIDGTLIYVITDTSQEYRIRFTHGHDWDLFNTYSATDKEDLLYSKPFGYYVTRALESTRSCYCDTQQVLGDVTLQILEGASPDLHGSTIVELLSQRTFQMSFLRLLLEKALKRNVTEKDYVLMDEGKWIRLENILKYRLFERAIAKFGASRTYTLLTGAVGTFEDFLRQCSEDVAVLGHTHTWDSCVLTKENEEMIYVNAGTWIDYKEEVCFSKILPPKEGEDGLVEICHNGDELI